MNKRTIKRIAPSVGPVCPRCHADKLREQTYSDTIDFRNMELDVEGLHMTICDACGHSFHSKAQLDHNYEQARISYGIERDHVRIRDGLLSSVEISEIREFLGLRQRDAAALFGGGSNAFNKYESGEVLQSVPMDRLLRLSRAVGNCSVTLLQSFVERRQLAQSVSEKLYIRPLPPALHVSDGTNTLTLTQPNTIAKVISAAEGTTFGISTIPGVSVEAMGFYLRPSAP